MSRGNFCYNLVKNRGDVLEKQITSRFWPLSPYRAQTVPEFLMTMRKQHDAILRRAKLRQAQLKKQQLVTKTAILNESKRPQLSGATKEHYQLQNLRIDYQFNVHKLRVELNLDEKQFACQANLSLARVKEIEAGKALPTMEELLQLARISGKFIKFKFE